MAGPSIENDAAERIVAAVAGKHLERTAPREGRIDLKAACDGLLRIDVPTLIRHHPLATVPYPHARRLDFRTERTVSRRASHPVAG